MKKNLDSLPLDGVSQVARLHLRAQVCHSQGGLKGARAVGFDFGELIEIEREKSPATEETYLINDLK